MAANVAVAEAALRCAHDIIIEKVKATKVKYKKNKLIKYIFM